MTDLEALTLPAAAQAYARIGWHVFPCAAGSKLPLAPACRRGNRGHLPADCKSGRLGHGVKDATARPDWVAAWWDRWPYANVAVACGPASGILVVDVDDVESWQDLLDTYGREEPATAVVVTPSGGRHLVFRYPEGEDVGNSVGIRRPDGSVRGIAPGVDVRSDGGYVVAPPSVLEDGRGYRWERLTAPLPLPDWLLAKARRPPPPPPQKIVDAPTLKAGEDGTAYGLSALRAECDALRGLTDGRNRTLNDAAFRLGRLVAGGELREEAVRGSLWAAACEAGCPPRYVKTLESGLSSGLRAGPRVAPHRAAS